MRGRRWVVAISAISALAASLVILTKSTSRDAVQPRTIRVGMQASPPWYSISPQGAVYGPVVEIIEEAARRGGLRIEWKPDPLGPENAMGPGNADLWPLMGRLASRLGRYPITESWLDLGYTLVTLESCEASQPGNTLPRTVARRDTQVVHEIVSEVAPGAVELIVPTHSEALEALCSGKADAAVIAELQMTGGGALVPSTCRERKLCLSTKHLTTLGFGIGARPGSSEAREAAGVLRSAIDGMIDDGRLPGILLKWGVPSGEIRALRLARLDRVRANISFGIALGLVAVVGALVLIYRKLLSTSRKLRKTNEELSQSQAALQAEFALRVEAEASLHQAQKLESVGRLAGGIAHDFNNMLTVILGYAGMLKEGGLPYSTQMKYASEIEKAGNRSKEITAKLLGFSRQQTIAPTPLNLNHLVADLLEPLGRLIGEDIEVAFFPAPDLWTVVVDSSQVNQILMNLVVNARDAMPKGGKLTIETKNVAISETYSRTHTESRPGRYVMLAVSDNGSGIPPEVLPRIFEPFFTTKPEGQGTGLGLPMIYGIVKQNGGFVNVYSELGRGTTFQINIPGITVGAADSDVPDDVPEMAAGPGKVLVVEDDALVRGLVTSSLEILGYSPLVADSPEEAVEICASAAGQEICLVLSDVVMPGMDGMELRRQICRVRPEMRVLFMSGYTSNVIMKNGMLEPGMHFIQKPFTIEDLGKRVEEALGSADRG